MFFRPLMKANTKVRCCLALISFVEIFLFAQVLLAQDGLPTLEEVKAQGIARSGYRDQHPVAATSGETPKANSKAYRAQIEPLLEKACFQCHGVEVQEAGFRLDKLDPDLIQGDDVDWWLEVVDVLSNGEMPPADEGVALADEDRSRIIEWLSKEIQVASHVKRNEQGHSSFRRMTRYEYNYALQDLTGLPYDFAADLPPETHSEDGFQNSSEMLQMSVKQFETYRELGRKALEKSTVRGKRPELSYYSIPMDVAMEKMKGLKERRKRARSFFRDLETGEKVDAFFNYQKGLMSNHPISTLPEAPPYSSQVLIIPAGAQHKIDLGDSLPNTGTLRIRVRAARAEMDSPSRPALRLKFGFQPSNDSRADRRVDSRDVAILASPDRPQFYQWDIPLSEMPRNNYRGVKKLGELPNPTEYVILANSISGRRKGSESDVQVDYLEISTPLYEQWPPESHARIFIDSANKEDETVYAREVLSNFLPRAWRRAVKDSDIDRHLSLFTKVRTECGDFQEAMIEVLATTLASPNFLYVVQEGSLDSEDSEGADGRHLSDYELATRLSLFLWCSTPDQELLDLAARGKLNASQTLVRQWLGMQLLDYLDVEEEVYPEFDTDLKEAMQQEPIVFFQEMLENNRSVLDILHADYAMANGRLAQHYGIENVYGSQFRKVSLNSGDRRGGLMTQAGLLAMNSDGKDSHPLKRGIWLLERILNDPPPPAPPAVPQIDLVDPEIAKLTLKERIENHRNDPACSSCHAKIDPWGIAFENFDAVGKWRDKIEDKPVDASSRLFNNQKLDGVDGLKRFLLANRQDQFCRAMVYKLSTFALGRPLSFADRSSVDQITADLRKSDDGLATLVSLIVTSELFQSK
jgi:mono/diheme cytochrome c family protein